MYTFFNKNQIILAEIHCFYFFSGFQAHFSLFCSCSNYKLPKKGITVEGWGIHIFGTIPYFFNHATSDYVKAEDTGGVEFVLL